MEEDLPDVAEMNQDVIVTKQNLHGAVFLDTRDPDHIINVIMIANTILREKSLLQFLPRLNNLE